MQHTDDTELKQIMQKAVMLQNGTVASLMAKSGVRGLMNYGVPLPDLRRIAAEAGTNHALARRLCQLNIREARILASMLFDASQLTNDDFALIYNSITNIDMAENFAQNIVRKLPALPSLILFAAATDGRQLRQSTLLGGRFRANQPTLRSSRNGSRPTSATLPVAA